MTRISEIHGIPANEFAGRAMNVSTKGAFIPYLSMTKGEMKLALLAEEAKIMAQYYGGGIYKDAETMLKNALYQGVHSSPMYFGAYDPVLRPVAKRILEAKQENQPASRAAFYRPNGLRGIHIGDPIIDYDARGKQCLQWAESADHKAERNRRKRVCEQTWRVEKILNDGIENCGQYLAYGYLPRNNNLPGLALNKIQDQLLGQQDIARVGKFDMALTQQWLNVGMMRRNADVAKIKPYGWIETNAILTALPEAGQKELITLFQTLKRDKTGGKVIDATAAGARMSAIIKKYKGSAKVGEPITVTIAIIGAVTALIGAISKMAQALKTEQADAFSQVNGFGARALGPEDGDWSTDDDDSGDGSESLGSDNTMLLLGAAAVAFFLLKDE